LPFGCFILFLINRLGMEKSNSVALLAFEPRLRVVFLERGDIRPTVQDGRNIEPKAATEGPL
jgi:hypothetical protein